MNTVPRQRIGMSLPIAGASVQDAIQLVQHLESLAWDDIWLGDGAGQDALTLLPLLLANTFKMRMGTAVTPVFTRTPAVLASSFSVINQAFPERFIAGLGSSSHAVIENWHGLPMEKPLTRIKETVSLLRSIMAGKKTHFNGEVLRSNGYQQPANNNQAIYLAGLRPKMLETAAEIADGIILNLFPRTALPKIMEHIAIGAKRGGKDPAAVEVVCRYVICVNKDKALGRKAFREQYLPYYATKVYNKYLAWAGYEDAAYEIAEGFKTRDRARSLAAMSDELVDEIAIIGDQQECQQRVLECAKQGVHAHVMSPLLSDKKSVDLLIRTFSKDHFSFEQ